MYKKESYYQISFKDFNQCYGFELDENNQWVKLANRINWQLYEKKYEEYFPSKTGNVAKSFRMAIGALIIQKVKRLSDREVVKEIIENPYLQYFIGLKSFKKEAPFAATLMVYFRKRINKDYVNEINEIYIKEQEKEKGIIENIENTELVNIGTAIIDATCSPSNIKYPQDFVLLNQAREKLEEMIDYFHKNFKPYKRPRTYRRVAHIEYLRLAKKRKKDIKTIRATIRKQINYVERNIKYVEKYIKEGYEIPKKYEKNLETIKKLLEQQKEMYKNKTHHVKDRIVSTSQPYIRPIVRGKEKAPVEFGAKYDVSINENGYARLEKISFDPYNENTIFKDVIERYRKRTGHYPERVLVDKIYRTKENRDYSKEHNIKMSGIKLGKKDKKITKEDAKADKDRIEIERFFSLEKSKYGAGLIMTKLEETTLCSIALSIFVANLVSSKVNSIFLFYFMEEEKKQKTANKNIHLIKIEEAA